MKRGVYRVDMRDLVLLLGLPADTEIVSVSIGAEHVDFLIGHPGMAEVPDGEQPPFVLPRFLPPQPRQFIGWTELAERINYSGIGRGNE
jgi:hypothetical protein